jgi:hypothetical protein
MAGAGYKLFNTGDVLTAAQVNTYLQEQVVMVFADAAARTTALSGVLAEGMVSYLKSTKVVEIYNGTAWASLDDPNAIQNTIVDAKGDLITATGNDVPARLAVGNNGDTLVADSAASTGLRWQVAKTQNAVYNSSFDIWQRGTSFTANAGVAYTADRWVSWATTAGQSIYNNRQSIGNLSVTPNQSIQYCMRQGRTSGNINTGAQRLFMTLESADSYRFAGKTVTLSFYARAGSGFTGTALTSFIATGTGTDQIYYSFTGLSESTQNNTITTSWQRFSQTVTLATNTTEVAFGVYFLGVGTAGANDFFEITGVQFEEGSVATTYSRMSGTIQGELAAAMRYYYRVDSANAGDTRMNTANMVANSTTVAYGNFAFPVRMRTSPTFGSSAAANWSLGRIAAALTALAQERSSQYSSMVKATVASGLTAGNGDWLEVGNNNTSYIEFSAEL